MHYLLLFLGFMVALGRVLLPLIGRGVGTAIAFAARFGRLARWLATKRWFGFAITSLASLGLFSGILQGFRYGGRYLLTSPLLSAGSPGAVPTGALVLNIIGFVDPVLHIADVCDFMGGALACRLSIWIMRWAVQAYQLWLMQNIWGAQMSSALMTVNGGISRRGP